MIKGAQKQMIVVRTPESRYFDEAYFVLRREIRSQKSTQETLLGEADKILNEKEYKRVHPVKARIKPAVWLLLGAVFGGGFATILLLLLNR